MTSDIARLRGKAGGLATVARHGPDAIAARARDGLWRRFENAIDPERQLPAEERHRRATLEQRRYYAALTIRSTHARATKARKEPTT